MSYLPPVLRKSSALYRLTESYIDYRTKKEERALPSVIHFDSRLRDKNLYPYSSDFSLPLPYMINDILQIDIKGLEFSNSSSTSINMSNHTVSWINVNEADIGYPIYTAKINIGSFTVNAIVTELLRVMNAVPRKKKINGQTVNHTWDIELGDTPMNALTFYNITLRNDGVSTNPITTTADSGTITIAQTNHGLKTNDIVYFVGIDGSPGGIPDSVLNSFFKVSSIIDENSFTIDSSILPYITGSFGGDNVQIGTASNFAFVSDPNSVPGSRNLLQLLGFPKISSVPLDDTFTLYDLQNVLQNNKFGNDGMFLLPSIFSQKKPFSELKAGQTVKFLGAESLGFTSETIVKVVTTGDQLILQISGLHDRTEAQKKFSDSDAYRLRIYAGVDGGYMGASSQQSNVFNTGSLYGSIDLSGDSYCFLSLTNANKSKSQVNLNNTSQNNLLAKIQLTSTSGYIGFNQVLGIPMSWMKGSGARIEELTFSLTDSVGHILFFGGLEFSGTLVIKQDEPDTPSFLL